MDSHQYQTTHAIARILQKSRSVLFITGAGISADSGIPTFRGIGGLYDVDLTEEGIPIESALSGSMLQAHPEITWKYLAQIAKAARGATFNRAHEVIAQLEQRLPRVWTLTQNVDGFHLAAGSRNVIEIHGNMGELSCLQCAHALRVEEHTGLSIPPRCPACDQIMRPNVVLFEEMLPEQAVLALRRELENGFEVVFSIGTSATFPYVQEPMAIAHRSGVPTVEVNPAETPVTALADYRLALGAATAMDAIWRAFAALN